MPRVESVVTRAALKQARDGVERIPQFVVEQQVIRAPVELLRVVSTTRPGMQRVARAQADRGGEGPLSQPGAQDDQLAEFREEAAQRTGRIVSRSVLGRRGGAYLDNVRHRRSAWRPHHLRLP